MRSSRGDLGDIPSRDKADGTPASARSRRVKAREQVAGWKSRPFRQREIAAGPSLTSREILLPIPEDDTMNATCATACGLAAAQAKLQPSRTTGQRPIARWFCSSGPVEWNRRKHAHTPKR